MTDNAPIVLILAEPVNESDSRTYATGSVIGNPSQGPHGYYGAYDWRVWDGTGYGNQLARSIRPGGPEYSVDVHDCGQYVSVVAHYNNPATGKKISQSFIVAFKDPKKGDATVFMTSTKWRTVSSISQAANYISSSIRSLSGTCR